MKTIFKSMSCLILGAMIVTPMFAQQKDLYPELEGLWGIERSGFFNGREKWAKGFENQRV